MKSTKGVPEDPKSAPENYVIEIGIRPDGRSPILTTTSSVSPRRHEGHEVARRNASNKSTLTARIVDTSRRHA